MITLTGTGSVSFRNPDIANKYTLDTGIIQRYTRGQQVIVYKDTLWKSIETEVFAFQHIRETKRQEIEDFLAANRGTEITISKPRRNDCAIVAHTFTGYIYSDVVDYQVMGKDGCAQLYSFGLVVLYKIGLVDLNYLLAESGMRLITEAGSPITTEAD